MQEIKKELEAIDKITVEIIREEEKDRGYFRKSTDLILYDNEKHIMLVELYKITDYFLIRDKVFLYIIDIKKIPTLMKITYKNNILIEEKMFEFSDFMKLKKRDNDYIKNLLVNPGQAHCSENVSADKSMINDRVKQWDQLYCFDNKFANEKKLDLYCATNNIKLNKKKFDVLPKNFTNMINISTSDPVLKLMVSRIFKGDTRIFSIDGIPTTEIVPFLLFDEFSKTQKYILYNSIYAESVLHTVVEMKKYLNIHGNKELYIYLYKNYGGFFLGNFNPNRFSWNINLMAEHLYRVSKIEFLDIGDPLKDNFNPNYHLATSYEWENLEEKSILEYEKLNNQIEENDPIWRSEYYLYILTKSEFPDAVFQFKVCINYINYYYDIYIPSINTIIEYHGQQHYEPVEIFGGEENFVNIILNDKIKCEYLKNENINFLEWKYTIPITRYNFLSMLNLL